MFTPWIKRKSLKKAARGKSLIVSGERPSMIMLMSLSALLVLVGVFVVQRSMAASWWGEGTSMGDGLAPAPIATPIPVVSATPVLTPTPTATPAAQGTRLY